jgi:WhiB family redox-sensing transcriptional regulator
MTAMTWTEDWASLAQCRTSQPDELFVKGAAQNKAKQLCGGCPVRTECLAEALDNEIEWGVWGGLTERERRAILRKRPNVTSWRALFETAQREHAALQTEGQARRTA